MIFYDRVIYTFTLRDLTRILRSHQRYVSCFYMQRSTFWKRLKITFTFFDSVHSFNFDLPCILGTSGVMHTLFQWVYRPLLVLSFDIWSLDSLFLVHCAYFNFWEAKKRRMFRLVLGLVGDLVF